MYLETMEMANQMLAAIEKTRKANEEGLAEMLNNYQMKSNEYYRRVKEPQQQVKENTMILLYTADNRRRNYA